MFLYLYANNPKLVWKYSLMECLGNMHEALGSMPVLHNYECDKLKQSNSGPEQFKEGIVNL